MILGSLIGMGAHPKAWGAWYKPGLAKPGELGWGLISP